MVGDVGLVGDVELGAPRGDVRLVADVRLVELTGDELVGDV